MTNVFASTTVLLATEFVDKFPESKLSFTLARVGRKTGVKISRGHNHVSVAGQWPLILEAHDLLLGDFRNLDNPVDNENADLNDIIDDDEQENSVVEQGSAGDFLSTSQVKEGIPEPVIYYEYKDQMIVGKDMMSPGILVEAVKNVGETGSEAASLKKMIKEKYEKSKESLSEKDKSEIENSSLFIAEGTEASASTEVKVEKTAEDTDEYDEMTDTEVVVEETLSSRGRPIYRKIMKETPTKRKTRSSQKGDGTRRKTSRRKSVPQKYIPPENGEIKEETDEPLGGENISSTEPAAKRPVRSRKKGKKKTSLSTGDGESYPCKECPYVGKGKSHLREHVRRQHGTKYKCDQCDRSFGFNKDLNRHKQSVHTAAEYFCEECNKFYKAKRVFDEHIRSHQEGYVKPTFDCNMCEKKFSTKYVLATHIKAEHLGMKKSFLCPTCGRSFTQKNSYRQHANVHAGIRPYVCDICGKAFTYEKSLKEHKFLHENVRRFLCEVCHKSFMQSTSLRIHMKVHQEVRDYMCTSCGKGFTQKQALMRHERIHSGDKPYVCSLCDKHFSDYSIIRRHMILIHKKDPKKWQDGVISHVKKKKDYYIEGGPGHRKRTPTQDAEKAPAEVKSVEDPVDKAIKEVSDAAIKNFEKEMSTNVAGKLPHTEQTEKKTYCELENYTGLKSNSTTNQYSSNNYGAPNLMEENTGSSTISDKVGVIKDTPMPINYSTQPASSYSPNVSSGPTQDNISQGSLVSRYHHLEDMYNRELHHQRSLYVPVSGSDQMRQQLQNLPYSAPVTADQTQPLHGQPAHNQWSFLGYPSYYNPASFPQFQGPQN